MMLIQYKEVVMLKVVLSGNRGAVRGMMLTQYNEVARPVPVADRDPKLFYIPFGYKLK
jgi:hypothetical protein